MLQSTPSQNQAARSTVYTIRSKYPSLRYPLADAIVDFFGSLFITAENTNHHNAALAPSPADNVQSCRSIEDLAIRALYFAGQIENDGTVLPRKSGPPVSPNIRIRNTVVSGYLGCLHK